jgi:hypothetical protein
MQLDTQSINAGARLASAIGQAITWPGMGAQSRQNEYTAVILPNDPPHQAKAHACLQVVKMFSSCALVGLAYYRAIGVQHPLLSAPYLGKNTAVTQVVSIASAFGAWRLPVPSTSPDVGDVVLIGKNGDPNWGVPSYEHVVVIVGRATDGLAAIEGGQGRGGAQIGATTYNVIDISGRLWLSTPRGRRRIAGWCSGAALAGACD